MSTPTKNKEMVPTCRLRLKAKVQHYKVPNLVLQQWFVNKVVLQADGRPAGGEWRDVPVEVVDD
jgi:hypothetical protein